MSYLSVNEYKQIYHRLNKSGVMSPQFTPKGLLIVKCDGIIVNTLREMEGYKEQEQQGHKFYYTMESIPFDMFRITKSSNNSYTVMMDDETILIK